MNGPTDGSLQLNRERSAALPIFGAFVVFFVFWLLGWPAPAMDDLFYNGAAINMAKIPSASRTSTSVKPLRRLFSFSKLRAMTGDG